jgi:hypothetical protein
MHDGIGDGLAQGLHRVFRDILTAQSLDAPGHPGVPLDEPHGVLDIGDNSPVEVLAVQDMNLVGTLGQKAGDVGLVEEVPDIPGEKQDAGVAEDETPAGAFGRLDIDQDVLGAGAAGDAAQTDPASYFSRSKSWG